ncbi:alpha/beta hydrolase [Mesobacillus foraminis]|uniref:alpha/beta fold hydrolase n=1 Tax=Mesobacillus foraminis TaxID=279826 RepID=UPI00399FE78E
METDYFSGYKNIAGIDLYYEQYAHPTSKETVVLLHGFLSSLFSFRHLVPLLKEEYSVVSVDLPPFGKSGKSSSSFKYSFKSLAGAVASLMQTLKISQYTLIGHSMGGQISLNLLYHYPGSAKKAVLLCSSGYSKRSKLPLILLSYLPFSYLYVKYYLGRSGVEQNLRNVVYDHSMITEEMREGYLSPFLENGIFKGLARMIRHHEGDLPADAIRQVKEPCLLIWGEHDKVVPLHIGKRLHQDLPQSRLIVLKETGHLVPEERPQEVCRHIKGFLREHGSDTANGSC